VDYVLQSLVDFPWAELASFVAFCIGLITLSGMFFPRIGKWRNWIGENVQDMIGIGGMRRDMQANMERVNVWIEIHSEQARKRDDAIAALTTLVSAFVKTTEHQIVASEVTRQHDLQNQLDKEERSS
jgi:hypothetical protein